MSVKIASKADRDILLLQHQNGVYKIASMIQQR
jgi:hypothetical protein